MKRLNAVHLGENFRGPSYSNFLGDLSWCSILTIAIPGSSIATVPGLSRTGMSPRSSSVSLVREWNVFSRLKNRR